MSKKVDIGAGTASILDRHSFETWLNAQPSEVQRTTAVVLASRTCLRTLPFINRVKHVEPEQAEILKRTVLWRSIISRCARTWPDQMIRDSATLAAARGVRIDNAFAFENPDSVSSGAYGAVNHACTVAIAASTDTTSAASSASTSAIYTAVLASGASDSAFGSQAAEAMWDQLFLDALSCESSDFAFSVMESPLWTAVPDWWQEEADAFRIYLAKPEQQEGHWQIWLEWFDAIVRGEPAFGLRSHANAYDLERAIVSGGKNEQFINSQFWDRKPREINEEIAKWVAEARAAEAVVVETAKPVFISYAVGDLDQARRIGDVIDAGGFTVFAQYKDMPPGSNFVAQMQSGLASMGKFVPVYSPRYLTSDHCQAEWNAAYNMDPLGKRKLIVGFLLQKTDLRPLQRQIVYVPLYGLTEAQAKSAILSALSTAGAERTPLQTRQAAKDYAVPVPETNAAGQLTFVPSAEVEQPFIDDDITRLPMSMLRVIAHLLTALDGPSNAPQLVKSLLQGLQGELTVNGAMAHVPDLQRDIEMLLAERAHALSDGAVWADGGFGAGIDQLETMFASYRQNFPLVMLREIERRQAAIDPSKFDAALFSKSHDGIASATRAFGEAGRADASVAHVVSQRQRQRRDIETLGRYVPQSADRLVESSDERTVDDLKKDFMFDESGLWDRTLGRIEKVNSIADSSAGKALIGAAKEFLRSIWGA